MWLSDVPVHVKQDLQKAEGEGRKIATQLVNRRIHNDTLNSVGSSISVR